MSGFWGLGTDQFYPMLEQMASYGDGAVYIVNDIVHEYAGQEIYKEADALIHASGRRFKGHSSSAKGSDWKRLDTKERLEVTVGTKGSRRYLYFPDDGSNTVRHFGNQQFMMRGAQAATPRIIDKITNELVVSFERSS